jgi:PAS domain S-box-containing protein
MRAMIDEAAAVAAPAPEPGPVARHAYPIAIAVTLAALLLRGLLDPWLGGLRPTVTIYGAVAAAVWLGGAGPAVLSAALGFVLAQLLYVEPRGSLGPWDTAHVAALGAYLFSCALIVGFGMALRRSRAELVAERARLQREVGMRRESELAARRSADTDARLAALLRHSHDAIVGTSVEGLIEVWNPTAERLFGYTSDEVVGRPISLYAPPERAAEQEALIARVLAGETVSAETQRVTKGGERLDVLLRITPMRDAAGRIVGHAGSLQDISASKRAEARLRESEATLRAFYDNPPVCLGVVEPT